MRGLIAVVILAVLTAPGAWGQSAGLPPDNSRNAQRLPAPQRQMLGTVARNAATAAQMGAMAGSRAEPGQLAQLAQAMAMTNGGLMQELGRLAGPENLPLRERVDDGELARLRALAGNDRTRFGREMLAWINRHYPDTIMGIDTLAKSDPRFAALAGTALPQLREQLAAAQELAQSALEGAEGAPH